MTRLPCIDSKTLRERIQAINRETKSKKELKQLKALEEKHLPKLEEYGEKLSILKHLNSYSKTDKNATFMRIRSKRTVEPEAVFGQMKFNKSYSRFRHMGQDKIKMDFVIFAIDFNTGKFFKKNSRLFIKIA